MKESVFMRQNMLSAGRVFAGIAGPTGKKNFFSNLRRHSFFPCIIKP